MEKPTLINVLLGWAILAAMTGALVYSAIHFVKLLRSLRRPPCDHVYFISADSHYWDLIDVSKEKGYGVATGSCRCICKKCGHGKLVNLKAYQIPDRTIGLYCDLDGSSPRLIETEGAVWQWYLDAK